MYEVELKVQADHNTVRECLDTHGASHRESVRQVDIYFDAPHRDFAETDEAFRLRREFGDQVETAFLTYKGPLVDSASKTRKEYETAVADGDAARAIAESLGFTVSAKVMKDRDIYVMNGYIVSLDIVDGLGEFVEVETTVGGGDEQGVKCGSQPKGNSNRKKFAETEDATVSEKTEMSEINRAKQGAVEVLHRLDLNPEEQIRSSYLSMIIENSQ